MDYFRINNAYTEFMTELFGFVPDNPNECIVDRKTYKEVLDKVSNKHGFVEGDPNLLAWSLTLVGRSPKLIDNDEEGAEDNGEDERSHLGTVAPSTANGK